MIKSKIFIVIMLLRGFLVFSGELDDPQSVLLKSDEAYIPDKVKFDLLIETYEGEQKKQWYSLECYVNGAGKYLAIFNDPGIMRGQSQLRLGNTIFNYVKKVDKISQVSARVNFFQSILTQEDIMSTMLSNFYNVESIKSINRDGNEYYSMTLKAKNRKVAYEKIIAIIDSKTYLPVSREYFSRSGQKIKEMTIKNIHVENGQVNYVDFKVVDSLRPQNYSTVEISNFDTSVKMSSHWFSKQYMKAAAR